jgi:hypothetical protein
MASYPRLDRGAIRAKVRNLTAIESTNIVTDAHINDIINQELHNLIFLADDVERFWQITPGVPFTQTYDGITYRLPGWRFDNTTQFAAGLYNNVYMNSDVALAPWATVGNTTYTAGYFDLYLVYKASARLLAEQEDESKRSAEFEKQSAEIAKHIIAQEYVGHNGDKLGALTSSNAGYELTLYFKTLLLLKAPLSVEAGTSSDGYGWATVASIIKDTISSIRTELFNSYKWTHNNSAYSNWDPHSNIFAYGAAARLGARFGLNDAEITLLNGEFEQKKQSLVQQLISNTSGYAVPDTLAQMVNQVRALLQDFTTQIPETIIKSWINIEYQMLSSEFDWSWLTSEIQATLSAGANQIDLNPYGVTYGAIKNIFEVETDNSGQILDYQIVHRVPHILNGEKNESKYRYDIDAGIIKITPTPLENTKFNIRFVTLAPSMLLNTDTTLFEDRFNMYLIYRAAYLGSAWNPNAKNLAPMFSQEAQKIKDIMYRYYMTSASTEPFSMGENALETRKYLPQFKAL